MRRAPLLAAIATLACVPAAAQTTIRTRGDQKSIVEFDPVVRACVNAKGELIEAYITSGSGHAEIDAAALKVARAARFTPGKGKFGKLKKSCVSFVVKFVLKDDKIELADGAPPPAEKPAESAD